MSSAKKCIIIFIFMLFNSAFAEIWEYNTSFEKIVSSVPHLKSIKCKFKQEKIIPNIDKPLISYGDFEFIENKGIYFYTKYPVQSTVDYTNKNYKQINDVINAVSSKKYKKLEKEFDFFFEQTKENWTIGLKPKENTQSANFLSSIIIEGQNDIKKIQIEMINGSITTLWFEK